MKHQHRHSSDNGGLTKRAPDGWDSAFFGAFPELGRFPVSQPFSPQPPVTRAVGPPVAVCKTQVDPLCGAEHVLSFAMEADVCRLVNPVREAVLLLRVTFAPEGFTDGAN